MNTDRITLAATLTAVALSLSAAADDRAARFLAAEPVWPAGRAEVMNDSAVFACAFPCAAADRPVLRIAGASDWRVRLNGAFVAWGPARAARGRFRVDELPLAVRPGRNELTVEVSSWNANTYVLPRSPGFLQAEVVAGGRVLAATGVKGGFTARETGRLRRTARYSFQRAFTEAYRLTDVPQDPLPLERRPDVTLLKRELPMPDFSPTDALRPLAATRVTYDPSAPVPPVRFVTGGPRGFRLYETNALEANAWAELHRQRVRRTADAADGRLGGGAGVLYDLGRVESGFPFLTVSCAQPTKVWVSFAEVLAGGVPSCRHQGAVANGVVWELPKGEHALETFEPYSLRYVHVYALDGAARVAAAPRLRRCRNAAMPTARFESSDPELDAVFAAAVASLAPNAVDGLTDCPSRERACWQCDSYFMAKANQLFGGDRSIERFHLMNFADGPETEPGLAAEMFPPCYPADHPDGLQIGNWPWWFAIQLEDYVATTGDRAAANRLKDRLVRNIGSMRRRIGPDGLLVSAPCWHIIDYSRSDSFAQGVNYPLNFLFAATLEAMDRLYGLPDWAAEAKRLRARTAERSWNGRRFRDSPKSEETTEAAQYYAFAFGGATPATHAALWRELLDTCTAPNKAAGGLSPDGMFVGTLLRFKLLAEAHEDRRIVAEAKSRFGHMVRETGTMWECYDTSWSCCHGFNGYFAAVLLQRALGVTAVDFAAKTVTVAPTDPGLAHCRAKLPVPGGFVEYGWKLANGRPERVFRGPAGWTCRTVP